MAATLQSLAAERDIARRIAVLGPMRELGDHADAMHAALAPVVIETNIDHLILVGEDMRPLEQALAGEVIVDRAEGADDAAELLARIVAPGDAVLVKASNSIGLARLVARMAGDLAKSAMGSAS